MPSTKQSHRTRLIKLTFRRSSQHHQSREYYHNDVARCDETLVSLINLILFYGLVTCFVLGIDIRPEIKIPDCFFTCDNFKIAFSLRSQVKLHEVTYVLLTTTRNRLPVTSVDDVILDEYLKYSLHMRFCMLRLAS